LSAADPLTTSIAHREGVTVISIGGEIDLSTAPDFEAAIDGALDEHPLVVVVELSAVNFMSSAGLRILAATHEKLCKSGQLAVVASNPVVGRAIQLSGLDQLISLYPSLVEALMKAQTAGDSTD
jgi:anti-sigma B factor antagonist